MKNQKIEISPKTVVFSVFFVLFLWFLWQIKELLISLLIAFIIAGALSPFVDFFEKRKVSRGLASLGVYFGFIFIFFNLFYLVIPPLINEVVSFTKNLPRFIDNQQLKQFFPYFEINFLTSSLPNLTLSFFDFLRNLLSNIVFIVTTLFFGYYFLAEKNFIKGVLKIFYSESQAMRISHLINLSQKKTSLWFWAEIFLMTFIGVLTYVGLSLLGVKYALPLAVIAGLLEVVPTIGPIISAVPAVIIGFSQSFNLGLIVIVLYVVIQQLENNLIVPFVMRRITGVHPITVLICLFVGGKIAGVLGILISVPTLIFFKTLLLEWRKTQK
ncbi:MAG: AI-2E family transporter [Patescibacteria group bacterium]|nr:AI-2E family transporter [Patescibacteria group bacterium]